MTTPLASHPQGETLDVFEFLARVLTQIPKPRQHGVHYMGAYSSRARAFRKRKNRPLQSLTGQQNPKADSEPKLSSKKARRAQKKMGTAHQAHQARSSDRPSPVRLRGYLSRHRLHYRAQGDSENFGSSRNKKKRLALATRALATDFRKTHLSEYPDTRTLGVFLHFHPPGGRHLSTALP